MFENDISTISDKIAMVSAVYICTICGKRDWNARFMHQHEIDELKSQIRS